MRAHWRMRGSDMTGRGPRRDRYDVTLDRAAFVAIEYALAGRGCLALSSC